eukprot:1367399-Amorphochlora_amoeboformis.AAC.1
MYVQVCNEIRPWRQKERTVGNLELSLQLEIQNSLIPIRFQEDGTNEMKEMLEEKFREKHA